MCSLELSAVQHAGLMKAGEKPSRLTPQDIIEFVFFPVVNEGCRVVAEGIVDKPADLDVATVLAMGFPAYRCADSSQAWNPSLLSSGLWQSGCDNGTGALLEAQRERERERV